MSWQRIRVYKCRPNNFSAVDVDSGWLATKLILKAAYMVVFTLISKMKKNRLRELIMLHIDSSLLSKFTRGSFKVSLISMQPPTRKTEPSLVGMFDDQQFISTPERNERTLRSRVPKFPDNL